MTMKNIALIEVCFSDVWNKSLYENKDNLGLGYIGAYLIECGYNVDIINQNYNRLSDEEIISKIKQKQYILIGVSCSAQKNYPAVRQFVKKLRKEVPDVYIYIGGIFASIEFQKILNDLPELSGILCGEGEFSTLELVESLENHSHDFSKVSGLVYKDDNGNIVCNSYKRIMDLDALPFPIRLDNVTGGKVRKKYIPIFAGRGCYGNCSYCSIQKSNEYKFKCYRSPQNICDEIESLISKYDTHYFHFYDDIFYDLSKKSLEWLETFIDEVKKRSLHIEFRIYLRPNDVRETEIIKLKEIGLDNVFIGVESGVQRILDEMHKNIKVEDCIRSIDTLKNNGIKINLGFITFVPTMTFDELCENYGFLFKTKIYIEANLINRLNIYSGCEYIHILQKEGLLLPQNNFWERHNYKFKDKKVGDFYNLIQKSKEYFVGTRDLINEYELICIERKKYENFLPVKDKSLFLWEEIIKDYISVFRIDGNVEKIFEDQKNKIDIFKDSLENIVKHFRNCIYQKEHDE